MLSSSISGRQASPLVYTPLPEGYIRILELLPGSGRDPFQCNLVTAPIEDDSLSFVALSYSWGPEPMEYSQITVNGAAFLVRPNLFHALSALRLPNQARRYWIDAICIDQNNLDEKSLQIPLMSKIYTLSAYVLIWLGKSDHDSDYVMDCIRRH